MTNKRIPNYNDKADYNTNSPSYYHDLARKNKLIKLLAEKIWEYDERLDERLNDLEEVLSSYLSQWDERIENLDDEVSHIFVTWLNDGTLEQIINHDVLGNKADKSYVDDLNENVTAQLAHIGLNVKNFGAKGDGVSDDTNAVQEAVDYASLNDNKRIIFPDGVYLVSHIDMLTNRYSNLEFIGIGNATIKQLNPEERHMLPLFSRPTFARTSEADGVFNFKGRSATDPYTTDDGSVKNILIEGLTFLSDVVNDGFDELYHQIHATGVSGFTVQNCRFIGFLGDGIAVSNGVGSGESGGSYNRNVTIKDNYFDGVNQDNRQAISIYHCDSFLIDNNDIRNTTRSDMPGAIDVEPENVNSITRGGTISNNKIDNCGGGVGAIALVLKNSMINPMTVFNISDNVITNTSHSAITLVGMDATNDTNFSKVSIERNYIKDSNLCILINDVRDVHVSNNYIENMETRGFNLNKSKNVYFIGNTFMSTQTDEGLLIDKDSSDIYIEKNIFVDIKKVAISSQSTGIRTIIDNTFHSTKYTGNQIPFSTTIHTPEEAKKLQIKGNISNGNFRDIYTVEFIVNNFSNPSLNTPPSDFKYGETNFYVNSHPDSDYDRGRAGIVKVIRNADALVRTTIKFFYAIDESDSVYYCRANSLDEWGSWKKIEQIPM